MKERLKQILVRREKKFIADLELTSSAVLVPLYEKEGEWHLLFTKRTDTVENHKGQISFPGGKEDDCDTDFLATALREGLEEIGLDPGVVEVLGELDDEKTINSKFAIHPFVVIIPYPYEFTLCRDEVEGLLEVPISVLLDESNFREETVIDEGQVVPAYYYQYGDQVIWGATARILKKFLDLIRD